MAKFILKLCNICQQETQHRWATIKGRKGGGQFQCVPCKLMSHARWRKRHWMHDLARKANLRKRPDSILVTEGMVRDLYEQQGGKCALSAHPLDIQDKSWRPSLDRIDASKGYVAGNMQLVAWIVNRSKSRFSDTVFLEVCSAVAGVVGSGSKARQREVFEYAH